METSQNFMSAPIVSRLKEAGELRIEDFTKERVEFLTAKINEMYDDGIGISSTKLSSILYNYVQPMYKFEGIAYYAFGLIATREPDKKNGPLFFVRKEDLDSTLFPPIESAYHNYSNVLKIQDSVNDIVSRKSGRSSSWSFSSDVSSTLSEVLSKLGEVCDSLSSIVSTIK